MVNSFSLIVKMIYDTIANNQKSSCGHSATKIPQFTSHSNAPLAVAAGSSRVLGARAFRPTLYLSFVTIGGGRRKKAELFSKSGFYVYASRFTT
jgi:hypothetical protein